jgi:protein-S-isoprenylcysteine O-methyltransferase Ste14
MKRLIVPPLFVLLSLILIVLPHFLVPAYNIIPFPYNFAGLIICFGGFALMGKARDLFKKHNTNLAIETSSSLVTEGPYTKTRNPMYIGMFLLLLGIAVCFANLLSMLAPLGFILAIHLIFIPKEEKLMHEAFGNKYLKYKGKVKRWI